MGLLIFAVVWGYASLNAGRQFVLLHHFSQSTLLATLYSPQNTLKYKSIIKWQQINIEFIYCEREHDRENVTYACASWAVCKTWPPAVSLPPTCTRPTGARSSGMAPVNQCHNICLCQNRIGWHLSINVNGPS